MNIFFKKNFIKKFKKLPKNTQIKFNEKIKIFSKDPFNVILNNHSLHGKYANSRSINVTGNIRAVFEEIGENHVEFVAIGSHPELYS